MQCKRREIQPRCNAERPKDAENTEKRFVTLFHDNLLSEFSVQQCDSKHSKPRRRWVGGFSVAYNYTIFLCILDDQHRNTNMNNKDHIVGGSVASFIQVSSFFDHLAATFFSTFIDALLFFSQMSFRKYFVINTRFGISFFCTRHDCFGDLVSCIHLLCVSGLIFQNIVSCDFQSFCFISLLLFQALLAYVVILVRSIIFYLDSVRSKL